MKTLFQLVSVFLLVMYVVSWFKGVPNEHLFTQALLFQVLAATAYGRPRVLELKGEGPNEGTTGSGTEESRGTEQSK